jgi:hypothetical protein
MPSPNAKTSNIKDKAAKIKTFLKGKGHKTAEVNAMDLTTDAKGLAALLALHKVTPEQWKLGE